MAQPGPHVRPHILVVTADEGLREFLGDGLVMAGFWTSVIASGLQVLEVFRLRTFDLAIVDAALGDMSPAEVIRRLRARPTTPGEPWTDLPILVIAGDRDEISPDQVTEAGADGLILPPVELAELSIDLHARIEAWRQANPERPWADQVAQVRHKGVAERET